MSASTQALEKGGFEEVSDHINPRLIIAIDGFEKKGKSHFSLTAPGPIGYLDFDVGSEGVVQKFKAMGKKIYAKSFEVPSDQTKARGVVLQFQDAFQTSISHARTTIIDTATEVWELYRMAKFGKLTQVPSYMYTEVNSEFRKLIRAGFSGNGNLILLHKYRKQYIRGKDGKGVWSGGHERSGFDGTGHLVQLNLNADRDDDGFMINIIDCRQNANLAGKTFRDVADIPLCSFPYIAQAVFPDTKIEEWL